SRSSSRSCGPGSGKSRSRPRASTSRTTPRRRGHCSRSSTPEIGLPPLRAERSMLREVLIVEQNDPTLKRRWFESDYFDLFIWQDPGGAFVRFQLCYDVELNERALVWSDPEGFYHDGVDHGEGMDVGVGQAPILVRDGK